MDEITFTLKRKETKVNLEDSNGEVKVLYLRELNGVDRDEFIGWVSKKGKVGADGETRVLSSDGLDLKLLGLALETEDGKKVDKKWLGTKVPCETIDQLSELAQKMNKIGASAEEGND